MDLVNVAQTAIMQNYDIKGKRLLQTSHFTEYATQTNNFERINQVRSLTSKTAFSIKYKKQVQPGLRFAVLN